MNSFTGAMQEVNLFVQAFFELLLKKIIIRWRDLIFLNEFNDKKLEVQICLISKYIDKMTLILVSRAIIIYRDIQHPKWSIENFKVIV